MAAQSQLKDDELRRKLAGYGIQVGPVTTSTRPIYERKLKEVQRKRTGSSSASVAKKMKVEPKAQPVKGKQKVQPPPPPPRNKSKVNKRNAAIRATLNKGRCEGVGARPVPRNRTPSFTPDLSDPADFLDGEEHRGFADESMVSIGEGSNHSGGFHFLAPRSPSESQQAGPSFPNIKTMLQQGVQVVKNFFGGSTAGPVGSGQDPSVRSSSISTIGEELQEDIERYQDISPEPRRSPSPPPARRHVDQRRYQEPASSPSSSQVKKYDWELEAEDVHICRKGDGSLWSLGKGGFGVVYKGLMGGVDEVAVKVLQMNSPVIIDLFKQEIDMISKLRHRHIVQFYGACVDPSTVYMVTELMQTDLFSALRRLTNQYRWAGVYGSQVAIGIASGIHYLHSRKPAVVHRDIKSPNILLMDGMAKIADVGLARTKSESDMTAQRGFTAAWAAPEVVYRRRATEKIDIWSFGIILWEIVTGQPPRVGSLNLPLGTSPQLRSLYSSCTTADPQHRPAAVDVIQRLKSCMQNPT